MSEGLFGWTAPADGTYCFDLTGSDYDTSLAIMDAYCGAELGCDEDGGPSYTSYESVTLLAGDTVTVVVDSWSTSSVGTYVLGITDGACAF